MAWSSAMIEVISLVLAIVAIGIAVLQVREDRRVSKVHGRIVATQTHLTAELTGRRDPDRLKELLQELYSLVEELGDIDPRVDTDSKDREVRHERKGSASGSKGC
jgi:acyl-coenzyme A synthetase/AMP-(fatty) acid ligase